MKNENDHGGTRLTEGDGVSVSVPASSAPHVAPEICAYCGRLAEGNYSIHRDGFGVGPEVPLCDAHGSEPWPTLPMIWEVIAQPTDEDPEFAWRKKTP